MSRTTDSGFDIAVINKDEQAVALVQVKAHPVEGWERNLPASLARERHAEQVAYLLAIDPTQILLFKANGSCSWEPAARLDTRSILGFYDPDLPKEQVFDPYLSTLIEAWLRDLAYHWKSERPPGAEELAKTGFLKEIEGGATRSLEVF